MALFEVILFAAIAYYCGRLMCYKNNSNNYPYHGQAVTEQTTSDGVTSTVLNIDTSGDNNNLIPPKYEDIYN